jgi:hypothetical protein
MAKGQVAFHRAIAWIDKLIRPQVVEVAEDERRMISDSIVKSLD